MNVGAIFSSLNVKDIARIRIPKPPISEQRAIAEVLSALDDKIAGNRKTIETLDEMFMARWQVVLESELTPGATLEALIEESIGGDWGTEHLSLNNSERVRCIRGADIANLQTYQPAKMPERFLKPSSLNRRKTRHGDIAVEMSGGSPTQSTGRAAFISDQLLKSIDSPIVSSNFCRVLRLADQSYALAVYAQLRQDWIRGEFFQYENGSTGIKNLAFKEYAARLHMPNMSRGVLEAFNDHAEDLFNVAASLGDENRTLAVTRDALLPQLMSGKLRVRDAEMVVEAVV